MFGTINFGVTAGTLFVGFVLVRGLSHLGLPTVDNIWLVSLLLFTNGLIMSLIAPYLLADQQQQGAPSTTLNSRPQKPVAESMFKKLMADRYQLYVAAFEMLTTVARQLIDFQQFAVLGQFSEEEVKQTLALINGVQSCAMMPMQAIAGPVFVQLGVMFGIASLPLCLAIYGVATLVASSSSSLMPLIAARALFNACLYTIFSVARELLWLPLPLAERPGLKAMVNGHIRSAARVVGALLSIAMSALFHGHTYFSYIPKS